MEKMKDKNAIYYFLAKEGVRPVTVAKVNGIARQTMTGKLRRSIDHLSLATYNQIAKAVDKPVGKVIEEVEAIDKTLKENCVL